MVFIILFSRKNSSKEQTNESNVYSVSVNPTLDEKATFAPLSSGDHGKVERVRKDRGRTLGGHGDRNKRGKKTLRFLII